MQTVRVIELPEMRVACSGPLLTEERFMAFNQWFSAYHARRTDALYPQDFMWYNERLNVREWFYALPEHADPQDVAPWEVRLFPAGLYAVATCLNADLDQAADWMQTREELLTWAAQSDRFDAWENQPGQTERYPMFHIISPPRMMDSGLSLEDLYLPLREKGTAD